MLQDHSRNRTPMPAAQPPAGAAPPEPGPARAEAGIARMLSAPPHGDQPPVDFIEACDWALRHSAWINGDGRDDKWDDARLDRECDKADAVWKRAVETQAHDAAMLAAKSRLLLVDLENHFSSFPEAEPDARDRLTMSILRDAVALGRSPAPQDDADLLSLGQRFDTLHAAWRRTVEANREPSARREAAIKAAGSPSWDEEVERAAWELPGVAEASNAEAAAFDALEPICEEILRSLARTAEGFAVKARALIWAVWPAGEYERDASADDDGDYSKRCVRQFIETTCATAGVDWRGEPVGSAPVASSDAVPEALDARTVLDAIQAHEKAWQAYSRANAAYDALGDAPGQAPASDATIAAADEAATEASRLSDQAWRDLFTTRPQSLHDLWMLLTHIEQHHRNHHGIDDAPDIWGTLTGTVAALRTESKAPSTLPHDLSKLSVLHLSRLYEICRQQRDILLEIEGAPTCEAGDGSGYNALGNIVEAEGARFAFLSDDVVHELERRRPSGTEERNVILEARTRHHLLCNGTIEPELVAEIAAAWGTK